MGALIEEIDELKGVSEMSFKPAVFGTALMNLPAKSLGWSFLLSIYLVAGSNQGRK